MLRISTIIRRKGILLTALLLAGTPESFCQTGPDPAAGRQTIADTELHRYAGTGESLQLEPVRVLPGRRIVMRGLTVASSLMVQWQAPASEDHLLVLPEEMLHNGRFGLEILLPGTAASWRITFWGNTDPSGDRWKGLGWMDVTCGAGPGEPFPFDPGQMCAWLDMQTGTTVGGGECWDLARHALEHLLADWERPLGYGDPVAPEEVREGDIIQFRKAVVEQAAETGGRVRLHLGSPDHTAIVRRVLAPGTFLLAHQNFDGLRTVVLTRVDMHGLVSGTWTAWRPRIAARRIDD